MLGMIGIMHLSLVSARKSGDRLVREDIPS
jgi:hypothetical protein